MSKKTNESKLVMPEVVVVEKPLALVGNVVPNEYRKSYKDGSCGDSFAEAFKALKADRAGLVEIMVANGLEATRWADKNNGMLRMNLGNVLRGLQKKQDVRIGKTVFKRLPAPEKAEKVA